MNFNKDSIYASPISSISNFKYDAISQKLEFHEVGQHKLQTDTQHAFKKTRGYSNLDISPIRTALENRLIPEVFSQHRQRLKKAGLCAVEVRFQHFNFASMIALK